MKVNLNIEKEEYTANEAAQILGVTRQTIYKYGQEGKLELREYPHNAKSKKMYSRASVLELKKQQETTSIDVDKISLPILAKEWNVQRNKLYNLLRANHLPYKVDSENFVRPTTVISIEVKNKLEELLKKLKEQAPFKHAKSNFAKNSWNIAIYQKFLDTRGEERRLIRLEKNGKIEWGFMLENGFLPYKTALNIGYKTAYPMSQAIPYKSNGFSTLKLPKYDSLSYPFLDYLYQHWGINNLYIEDNLSSEFFIYIKEGSNIINLETFPVTNEWLSEHVVEGECLLDDELLIVDSNRKNATINFHTDVFNAIDDFAKKRGKSISEVVELAVKAFLSQET